LFERPQSGERAVLVHASPDGLPDQSEREEFAELATSAGAVVAAELSTSRKRPDPRYFIGKGKLEELRELISANNAELVISCASLSPSQERNLERELQCRVLDRAGLILDIFAQRARSFEGKLQVELAQLRHLSTRLVRGWTHLERQKGGIGLRGPGETQLETDRRLIGKRIRQLKTRLDQVDSRRAMNRQNRIRAEVPTVALVGYTNGGKSTLFNALTDANVYVEDKLFATLDPTIRRIDLALGGPVTLVDTVGLVRDLPLELVAAFQSTLAETRQARLLLHVIDCRDPAHLERTEDVNEVLRQIEADRLPVVQVYNKADILDVPPRVDRSETGMPKRVWLSAATGEGVDVLMDVITDCLHLDVVCGTVKLTVAQARLRALLYERATVTSERGLTDGGWELDVEIDQRGYRDLQRNEDLEIFSAGDDEPSAIVH